MNPTFSWMQSDWFLALGWTFVHSIWQIAVIGLALFVALRSIPGRRAHLRYTVATVALWLVVVSALSTFILMLPARSGIWEVTTDQLLLVTAAEAEGALGGVRQWLEMRMPFMLIVWLGGATILMIRLALSLGWLGYIRRSAMPAEAIQRQLHALVRQHGLRSMPVAAGSAWVPSPVTLGHLKPVILFPIAWVNRLSPREVEAILLHELAHIVRRDYLSNLIQSLVEAVFYYHPVTWWISRTVRAERENRADDLAVRWFGDPIGYARALVAVQEMQLTAAPSLAIGFASGKSHMLVRIQRILNLPYKHHHHMEKSVLLSLTSLVFLAFTLTSHTPGTTDAAEEAPLVRTTWVTDTIPTKGYYRIHKKTDNQEIRVEVENGQIHQLEIDGQEIEPGAYDTYEGLIDELITGMEAPPAPRMFAIPSIPPMPPMPEMPVMPDIPEHFDSEFDFSFAWPDMPEMPVIPDIPMVPDMGHMQWEQFFDGGGMQGFSMITDTTRDGRSRTIIVYGGDSTIVLSPGMKFSNGTIILDGKAFPFSQDSEEWKTYQEAWREQASAWRKHWREDQGRWREELRRQAERQRQEADRIRSEQRHQHEEHRAKAWEQEAEHARMREELRRQGMAPGTLRFRSSQSNLSDELLRDQLINADEEASVLLTPDKLKINGKKMPADVHAKYLRMYEAQQGIELTGNSRVEFTTKARKRF